MSSAGNEDKKPEKIDEPPVGYRGFGQTFDGTRFAVPETLDMFESICNPKNWGIAEGLVVIVNLYNFLTLAFMKYIPTWYFIGAFFFWRMAYNGGIGFILYHQSKDFGFDRWLQSLRKEWQVLLRKIATFNVHKKLESNGVTGEKPLDPAFESWMVFRMLSSMILANDGQTYCILAAKLFTAPSAEEGYIRFLFCFVIGFTVSVIAYIAKMQAHDCLGDYAWYWGDFWFRMEGDLIFDGVFELVPHPMYTVGYLGYYGVSLITRSHTLLVVSLLAHSCQIFFLAFIEEPHIQKLYGPTHPQKKPEETGREEMVGLSTLFLFRHADATTLLLLLTAVGTTIYGMGTRFYWLQILFWRAFQWAGLGTVMYLQSTEHFWTNIFAKRGYTETEAFSEWKKLFNTSYLMNHAALLVFAVRVVGWPYEGIGDVLSPAKLAGIVGAFVLMYSSVFVVTSVHESLGPDAWFFRDLFFEPEKSVPNYDGLYRYLDNPDCLFGYLGQYGLALFFRSWTMFWIVFLTQAANYAFVHLVEVPHMEKQYEELREAAGIERIFRHQVAKVSEHPSVRDVSEQVWSNAVQQGSAIRDKASSEFVQSGKKAMTKLESTIQELLDRLRKFVEELTTHEKVVSFLKLASEKLETLDHQIIDLAKRRGLLDGKDFDGQATEGESKKTI